MTRVMRELPLDALISTLTALHVGVARLAEAHGAYLVDATVRAVLSGF
jgi:hypothetical protein